LNNICKWGSRRASGHFQRYRLRGGVDKKPDVKKRGSKNKNASITEKRDKITKLFGWKTGHGGKK